MWSLTLDTGVDGCFNAGSNPYHGWNVDIAGDAGILLFQKPNK